MRRAGMFTLVSFFARYAKNSPRRLRDLIKSRLSPHYIPAGTQETLIRTVDALPLRRALDRERRQRSYVCIVGLSQEPINFFTRNDHYLRMR